MNNEVRRIKMNKKKIILIASIVLAIIVIGITIFLIWKNTPVEHFAIKTSSGYNTNIKNTKFRITNNDELKEFCNLYKGFELSKDYDLTNNTMFIQTEEYGSGSIKVDFNGVIINRELKFDYTSHASGIGTMDMAYWYLVAVVPNAKLIGTNVSEWVTPTELNSIYNKEYLIEVRCTGLKIRDSLNTINKVVNETGDVYIRNYSSEKGSNYYYLVTYNEEKCNQFIEKISSKNKSMSAKISSVKEKDKSEYNDFFKKVKENKKPFYYITLESDIINNNEVTNEIVNKLGANGIKDFGYQKKQLSFQEFTIEKIEKQLNIISQYQKEWKIRSTSIIINWYNY
jgi:hypothetical protein